MGRLPGLDIVLVLERSDMGALVRQSLGWRLDPTTGAAYHVLYDLPPTDNPGLLSRLQVRAGMSVPVSFI